MYMRGSRNFCQWGTKPDCQKIALTIFILVLNLFHSFTVVYRWFISKKTFRVGPTFSGGGGGGGGGGPTFSRGSNFFQGWGIYMLICIETHKTCDFPVGLDPLSPTSDSAHDVACVLNKIKKRKK